MTWRRRVQARARESEEELSRFCVDAGNRIPVTARHFIMAKVFEMVQLYSDLRADAAADRGAVRAPSRTRSWRAGRETAALHRRAILAETRTGLLHPVAVVNDAARAAPASTQPGAASGYRGPSCLVLPASRSLGRVPRRSSRAPRQLRRMCDLAWTDTASSKPYSGRGGNVRDVFRNELHRRWALQWSQEDRDTSLYKWVSDPRTLPDCFPPNKALVTLLTGHGRLPS
ncbi:hypothetical protein MTO96_043237 [Rhipicephalus appendiculatus]